jgi:protein-histidine pros-kinase
VTARWQTEIDTERARLEFFATVAHELATPVTSILGHLDAIGDADRERLAPDARQSLETLEREVARVARLAADLRVAAQTKSGELTIDQAQIRLGEVVAEAVEAARPRAEAKGVELR